MTTAASLPTKYQDKLCKEILGFSLIPSDSHVVEEGQVLVPLMTTNQGFYFVPLFDEPVLGQKTILNNDPEPIPGRFWYAIEVVKVTNNGFWEPPDYDVVEVARAESLEKAIGEAAHYQLDQKIECVGEGLFWEEQEELESSIRDYMREIKKTENNH